MYYELSGTGKPALYLPGRFRSLVIVDLPQNRKWISIDFRGHGRSTDDDRPLTAEEHAEDVAFRNGVYHYQADYFDNRLLEAFMLGKDFDEWVELLTHAFAKYFDAWLKTTTAAVSPQSQP